jgi:hypothetical protein
LHDANRFAIYIEAPTQAVVRGKRTLLGFPTFAWPLDSVSGHIRAPQPGAQRIQAFGGAAVDASGNIGSRFPWPTGISSPKWPRAVASAPGGDTLHVIWLESADSATDQHRASTLWYSRLIKGAWSMPERLLAAHRINWSPGTASVIIGSNGAVHVIATTSTPGKGSFVAYLRRDRRGWSSLEEPVIGLPNFATIAALSGDSVLIGFQASDALARESNGSHPYVMRVAGVKPRRIGPVGRVYWAGLGGTTYPHLQSLGRGRVGLVWVAQDASGKVDSLAVSVSDDGGRSWSTPDAHRPMEGVHALQVAGDGRGNIRVIYWTNKSRSMGYAVWRDRWVSDSILPFGIAASYPTLLPGRGDTLTLAWGSRAQASVSRLGEVPVTLMSLLVPNC